MIDPETKEYLEAVIGLQLKHLTTLVESQAIALRAIETNTTTQIARLNAQLDAAWRRIDELQDAQKDRIFTIEKEEGARQAADMTLQAQIKAVDDSQKLRWDNLRKEREAELKEKAEENENQAVINNTVRQLDTKFDRLTWLVASAVILIILYGVFDLLKLRAAGGLP